MSNNSPSTHLPQAQQDGVAPRPASYDRASIASTHVAKATPPTVLLSSQSSKEHTRAEWEALRPRFTELYLGERRRLADVSRILREEKGFHATDKQYKDRIRKWGLRKNFKDAEKREALLTDVRTRNGDHVTTEAATIPRHRLERFARDSKLLYVPRMAAGISPQLDPQLPSDIVIELPRRIFETTLSADPSALHTSFAAIDRLSKGRWPVLALEVLGVSELVVRYGVRYSHNRVQGMTFEMLPASYSPGRERGPGVRFYSSIQAMRASYDAPEEQDVHITLFHTIALYLFEACQATYLRRPLSSNVLSGPSHGQPPRFQCVRFSGSPLVAQRLYLRALAEMSIIGAFRYADLSADCEVLSSPKVGAGFRFSLGPHQDLIFTRKQSLHVAMHAVKRGDIVVGVCQFQPGFEGHSISVAGRFEQEATRLRTALSQPPGKDFIEKVAGGLQRMREPFLTDEEPLEKEFREASRRAASRTERQSFEDDGVVAYALISNPVQEADDLNETQRRWARLITTECIVDRNEPWKLVADA